MRVNELPSYPDKQLANASSDEPVYIISFDLSVVNAMPQTAS